VTGKLIANQKERINSKKKEFFKDQEHILALRRVRVVTVDAECVAGTPVSQSIVVVGAFLLKGLLVLLEVLLEVLLLLLLLLAVVRVAMGVVEVEVAVRTVGSTSRVPEWLKWRQCALRATPEKTLCT